MKAFLTILIDAEFHDLNHSKLSIILIQTVSGKTSILTIIETQQVITIVMSKVLI